MKTVASLDVELTVEERNLLSVAYKNVIGARRASWRIISSIEQKEENKASEDKLKMIKSYRSQVMNDFHFLIYHQKTAVFSSTAEMMTHSTCPLVTFQLWLFPRVYFHCNHSLDVFVEFYCLIVSLFIFENYFWLEVALYIVGQQGCKLMGVSMSKCTNQRFPNSGLSIVTTQKFIAEMILNWMNHDEKKKRK